MAKEEGESLWSSSSLSSSSITRPRWSLGHHKWFCNQFSPFSPILHYPLGLGELQACPFPDVVFPPLTLSALFSSPFHWVLQDGFGQTWWTGDMTIPHLHISYKDHVTNEEVRAKIQQAIGPHEVFGRLLINERWFCLVEKAVPIRLGHRHIVYARRVCVHITKTKTIQWLHNNTIFIFPSTEVMTPTRSTAPWSKCENPWNPSVSGLPTTWTPPPRSTPAQRTSSTTRPTSITSTTSWSCKGRT